MEGEDWREYLKKEREKYKKIGPIKCPAFNNEEKRTKNKSTAYFWTIKHQIHSNLRIRIIVRRLNGGMLHFFSIMKE
jgi:hypothetical protein